MESRALLRQLRENRALLATVTDYSQRKILVGASSLYRLDHRLDDGVQLLTKRLVIDRAVLEGLAKLIAVFI